jgi:hypothetical protein
MKRVIKSIVILGITIFLLIWGYALLRCEILTHLHWQEFYGYDVLNRITDTLGTVKVLEYSDTKAKVYYIDSRGGIIIEFAKKGEQWGFSGWDVIWSDSGSASDVIWPYWWHFIYGGF